MPQLPPRGEINVDHVAHFVPDIEAAAQGLEALGFTLTPFSPQFHRLEPGGPLVPAGTGNRCVMFERGYVEFLTPTADSPVAQQLRTAMQCYVGLHLIAFGSSDAQRDYDRLEREGFHPTPPVALQRPIGTPTGEDTARFTVIRVPPGTMAEGRIQFCHHHTPELVWQERWTSHPNGVTGLAGVIVCVADPAEAARRYSRFTGAASCSHGSSYSIETARGSVVLTGPDTLRRTFGVTAPALPWIAGYALETRDGAARTIELPAALGGMVFFQRAGANVGDLLRG